QPDARPRTGVTRALANPDQAAAPGAAGRGPGAARGPDARRTLVSCEQARQCLHRIGPRAFGWDRLWTNSRTNSRRELKRFQPLSWTTRMRRGGSMNQFLPAATEELRH